MLNTKDSLKLRRLLIGSIPKYEFDDNYFEFAGKIILNINNSDKPESFVESILLMYPKLSLDDVAKMETYEIIKLFMDGLRDNEFLGFLEFCRILGYD